MADTQGNSSENGAASNSLQGEDKAETETSLFDDESSATRKPIEKNSSDFHIGILH
jgi:hypothetical protein